MGIDPSLRVTGCARVDLGVDAEGRVAATRWETWRARAVKPEVDTVATRRRRIRLMLRETLALVPDFFDLAVVEGPAMKVRFAALADERAGFRWMLIDQLLARGPVTLVDPRTRALLGSGSGNGSKALMRARVAAQFPDANVPDDNVADAVALAAAGAYQLGMPWVLTEKQKAAHAKVAWPMELAA